MKHCLTLICLVAFVSILAPAAFSQQEGGIFSFSPAQVKIGETITLTYNSAAEGAALKDAAEIDCQALIARGTDTDPLLIETPLKKEGDKWVGHFKLEDKEARWVVFKLVSGENTDDNAGNAWDAVVYSGDGKPVQGALTQKANFFIYGRFYSYKHQPDMAIAKEALEREKQLYPDSWRVTLLEWEIAVREDEGAETKSRLLKDVEQFYKVNALNEEALSSLVLWYEKLGDSAKANTVREEGLAKYPKGKFAEQMYGSLIWKEKDQAKRALLMKKHLEDFPNMAKSQRESYMQNLFYNYIQMKDPDKASDLLSQMEKPEGGMYNELAWPLIEKGEQLEKAVAWAKKGLEMARNQDPREKPSYASMKSWEENKKYSTGMLLDTYAYGLCQIGKLEEAEKNYAEAYKLMGGEDPDVNARYLACMVRNKNYGSAIDLGLKCIEKGKDSEKLIESMKEAYARKEGFAGFDTLGADKKQKFGDMIAAANKIKIEQIREGILKSRISKPEVDFTLKDLKGNEVTLSALKGKVVVIDFWATWCGPCKQSFPYLQKVYEKYQNNEKVVFLAVNAWERQKDYAATVANAKKFMEANKYTFPVLIDEKIIDKYEVEGIPTKFIIDTNGNIAFKSVGFSGPGMVDELTQQIEVLLSPAN